MRGGATLDVWVVPGASRTEVQGLHDGALRVRVAAQARGGAANRALERYLSSRLGVGVTITHGHGARRKRVHVESSDLAAIADELGIGIV